LNCKYYDHYHGDGAVDREVALQAILHRWRVLTEDLLPEGVDELLLELDLRRLNTADQYIGNAKFRRAHSLMNLSDLALIFPGLVEKLSVGADTSTKADDPQALLQRYKDHELTGHSQAVANELADFGSSKHSSSHCSPTSVQ
jgi:hypothetical protein